MKTQIIQLEPHDDAISVKDKMEWGQTPRILLVWPVRGRILNRRLDLVFLKRHSTSLGAQLAFVTNDSDVRYYADKLGIPVFASIRKAEESHWRRPRRKRRKRVRHLSSSRPKSTTKQRERPDLEGLHQLAHPTPASWLVHPITRLIFFTLGVLGVLAIAAILVPGAEIQLAPKTQRERISIAVAASPQIEAVDLSGAIPARRTTVIVEGRGFIPSSGSIPIPYQTATGEVVFTNLTDQEISIPLGTVVSTLGEEAIRFATLQSGDIPPASESEAIHVQAVMPGNRGNVPARSILAIEGPLGLNLTVINLTRTAGGSDNNAPAPSESDYQKLSTQMLAALHETALAELETKLGSGDVLLKADPSDYRIIAEDYDPAESQPADQLHLTLRVAFQALTATGEDLHALGQAALEANLPEGFTPIPSTLEIDHKSAPVLQDEEKAIWQMQAQWQVGAQIDATEAIRLVLWLRPDEAANRLSENLPLGSSVEITLTPTWWPRLPILPFRISVISNQ